MSALRPQRIVGVFPELFVPASIAFGHPSTDLSGIFLKPLKAGDFPNELPFIPERRGLPVCYILNCVHNLMLMISSIPNRFRR